MQDPMQHYRQAAPRPPDPIVSLGPLPFRFTHVLPALILGPLGGAVAIFAILLVVHGSTPKTLRCSRAGEVLTCTEWRVDPPAALRAFSGPRAPLRTRYIGGKSKELCLELGNQITCDGPVQANANRLSILRDGESVELDATRPVPIVGIVVGLAFGFLLIGFGAWHAFGAARRRRPVLVRVGERTLEILSPDGRTTSETIPRTVGEQVRTIALPRGRGDAPRWSIEYGDGLTFKTLATFVSYQGPSELAPFEHNLRMMLATARPPR